MFLSTWFDKKIDVMVGGHEKEKNKNNELALFVLINVFHTEMGQIKSEASNL